MLKTQALARPARNVRLSVTDEDLNGALREDVDQVWRRSISRCFSERGIISVLGNGKAVSNDFGWLSQDSKSAWKDEVRLDIEVTYEDLDGRKFRHTNPILVAGDEGFAGPSWEKARRVV